MSNIGTERRVAKIGTGEGQLRDSPSLLKELRSIILKILMSKFLWGSLFVLPAFQDPAKVL